MSLWDDVKKVPILEVAKHLDIKIIHDKISYAIALCPFHGDHLGDGGKPNLSLIKALNAFKCHACGEKGSVIDLWAKVCQVEPKEALKAMAAKYGLHDPVGAPVAASQGKKAHEGADEPEEAPEAKEEAPEAKEEKKAEKKWKKVWDKNRVLQAHHDLFSKQYKDHLEAFLKKRGLTKEYAAQKRIGITKGWSGVPLFLTIPAFDKDDNLLSVRVHSTISQKDKRMMLGHTTMVFYDLASYDPKADEIWLCEGEGDLWTLQHILKKNAVTSFCGAASLDPLFHDKMSQLGTMEDFAQKSRIVLVPDNDIAGERAMATLRTRFPKEANVCKLYWDKPSKQKLDVSDYILLWGKKAEHLEPLIKTFSWEEAEAEQTKNEALREELQKQGPVHEHLNCYWRARPTKDDASGIDNREQLSTFVFHGKATIEIGREAYTRGEATTIEQETEKDMVVPPEAWRNKHRFADAFPHTKYRFTGSERDIQFIMSLVHGKIPKGKVKKGAQRIGFVNGSFVGPGFCITKDGLVDDGPVEYVPSGVPLESYMKIVQVENPKEVLKDFLGTIIDVNRPQVILPTIGWLMSCFFKAWFRKRQAEFPILVFFGTSGSGKTSLIRSLLRLFGLTTGTRVFNAGATNFASDRMLDCTNCVPLVIDEFKSDIGRDTINMWKKKLRSNYMGETVSKGKKDLTLTTMEYSAPLVMIGEMSAVREQASVERTISIRPERNSIVGSDSVDARGAFHRLDKEIPIEGLFVPIVQWAIQEGREIMFEEWNKAKKQFFDMKFPFLPERVWINFVYILFGLNMLEAFAKSMGHSFTVTLEARREAVEPMIGEILTVGNERTKMAFDEFIEALAVMAKAEIIKNGNQYCFEDRWLWVHLNSCVPAFREWARRTDWEGEVYSEKEYRNQAIEIKKGRNSYVHDHRKIKRFSPNHQCRSVMINLYRAEKLGLDVSGFGYASEEAPMETPPQTDDLEPEAPPEPMDSKEEGWQGVFGD